MLPKVIQEVINLFIDLKIQFIIEGRNGDINMNAYQKYLDFLIDQHTPVDPVRKIATTTTRGLKLKLTRGTYC